MKRLVIVPAKNEGKSIRKTLEQLVGEDVIVCDGGSKDSTKRIAKRMGIKVLECKSGYGKVILEGMRYGLAEDYEQFVVIDCESHTFSEIVPFLDCGADVIAGQRHDEKKPLHRKIITQVGRKMKPEGAKTEIVDISNGFRAYSRRFVERILAIKDVENIPSYTFNSIVAFYSDGYDVVQFPMSYIGGKSGLTLLELMKAWTFRATYEMEKPPLPPVYATTEDIQAYLRLMYGPQFDEFVRRRHND
jgi:glycosyltransferase involved in cell wall biosynthesis